MSSTTTNYGLYKPAGAENVNVTTDLNNNWDTLDTQLKAVSVRADLVGKLVASGFDGGANTPGDVTVATTNAYTWVTGRRVKVCMAGIGKCNAQAGTGHSYTIRRRINGGAWTDLVSFNKIYPSGAIDDSLYFETNDAGAGAGSYEWAVRIQGLGINGNGCSAQRIEVYDAGLA